MKELWYATTNRGKFLSMEQGCREHNIDLKRFDRKVGEIQSSLLAEVVRYKVTEAYMQVQQPVIALDAGCFIDDLKGFPGVYTKYVLETIGITGILKVMYANWSRRCLMNQCLGYMDSDLLEPVIFTESIIGILTEEPRGEKKQGDWSDLSRLFIPEGFSKTLAQMSPDEYATWRAQRTASYSNQFFDWFIAR